ncbi:MAG: hypothetical protein JWM25_1004 [Thermoleophilia bacterium]|nr:hypothetical protein [Thermoleophilia bacterium]MCZ4496421.1 hypothetical protein [Thermoleophilia bacterium]
MKFRSILALSAAFSTAALVAATSATAHVSVSTNNPTAGGYGLLTVSVPHGCEGAATNKLEIKVPDGVTSYAPERNPFWTSKVTSKKLDTPIDGGHGEKITESIDTVVYTAKTPLPDGELDLLPASIKFPDTEGPLYFPIVQTCVGGGTAPWNQIPEEGGDEPESPAPSVTLVKATEGGHGDAAAAKDTEKHGDTDSSAAATLTQADHDDLADDVDSARTLGIGGIVIGALGLLFGLVGFRRGRK